MKANISMNRQKAAKVNTKQKAVYMQIRKEVREEVYTECANDIMIQCLSTVFWTLATNCGYGAGRLKKLAEMLHDTKDLMDNPSRLHHKFSGLECEQIIKEKYGVDLRAEFTAEVEVKA